jgi:TrmH family RNA methyltransferase
LQQEGIAVYAAHLEGAVSYDELDYTNPSAILIGNEGNGLSEEAANASDRRIKIPMEGQVESLNAAISSAVFLYEAHRQRSLVKIQ